MIGGGSWARATLWICASGLLIWSDAAAPGVRRPALSVRRASPKLWRRREKTGSLEPAKPGRPSGGGKLASCRDFLIACVEKRPDITMPELAAALEA